MAYVILTVAFFGATIGIASLCSALKKDNSTTVGISLLNIGALVNFGLSAISMIIENKIRLKYYIGAPRTTIIVLCPATILCSYIVILQIMSERRTRKATFSLFCISFSLSVVLMAVYIIILWL